MQLIPESSPFSTEQRAWLNGFLAGMIGLLDNEQARSGSSVAAAAAASLLTPPPGFGQPASLESTSAEEPFPWHDSSLPIIDRMKLADGKPIERRMMAAMAQLNCGTCGYLCKTYAEAITQGSEKNLTLCSPGGIETAKMLRILVKESQSDGRSAGGTAKQDNKPAAKPGTRNNPVKARMVCSDRLNREGSAKDTRHVVVDLSKTSLKYRVGDALGIFPSNCIELVTKVLTAAKLDSELQVTLDGTTARLGDTLKYRCLRNVSMELVERAIESVRNRPKQNGSVAKDTSLVEKLSAFLDSDEFDTWDICDFLEHFEDLRLGAEEILSTLSPIRPRLYSIASSQSVYANEVHLTVGRVENEVRGRARKGVASTMLADRLNAGDEINVFIQPSHGFTIPENSRAPMIMVGPGTGIAPFMAFLQQRSADKAEGKNWLFFGDQRQAFDYLYEDQLEAWKKDGLLTRLSLAFSRDSDTKIYVQNRMKENGAELWSWLEQGGFFYVCGDASRMAVDVDKALHEIVAEHGKKTPEEAKKYIVELTKANRYVRDVY
jgi:sulfite reductase (NADPH) flavoprotein alpha-component